jgi:hypothetical protein
VSKQQENKAGGDQMKEKVVFQTNVPGKATLACADDMLVDV